jgi:NADH-quinone oxidoreductase subunit C
MHQEQHQMSDTIRMLQDTFSDSITLSEPFRGEVAATVSTPKIVEVCRFLKETEGLKYNYLSDITGIDYYPDEPRFALCYHLLSLPHGHTLRLKAYWSEGDDPVPSITKIWRAANWEEREAYDMFGIEFSGHPDLRRLLMPEDWMGFPQRKDYPLGYETVRFSFNVDRIDSHKPYAEE